MCGSNSNNWRGPDSTIISVILAFALCGMAPVCLSVKPSAVTEKGAPAFRLRTHTREITPTCTQK